MYLKLSIKGILCFEKFSGGLGYKSGFVIIFFVMYLISKHESMLEKATNPIETCVNRTLLSTKLNNFLLILSSEDRLSIRKPTTITAELPNSENKV